MIALIMKLYRVFFFPLLLAFVLLFAQQTGASHVLLHELEDLTQQRKDKQAPHSNICEKCADYAQFGSALNIGAYHFILLLASDDTVQGSTIPARSAHTFTAVARGPPQPNRIA